MAKQIYIDENGNPIEVSGTINTAELLPISGNDPTDTKEYIDTGLSGKADKFTHYSESKTSNSSGVVVSEISASKIITQSAFGNYLLLPYKSGGYWAFIICDVSGSSIVTQSNKTATLEID